MRPVNRSGAAKPEQDYRSLPTEVHLDETIETVEPGAVADPETVRNLDQHTALRDD